MIVSILVKEKIAEKIGFMEDIMRSNGIPENAIKAVMEREMASHTFLGSRIAVPHAVCEKMEDHIIIVDLKNPVQWGRRSAETADKIVFLIGKRSFIKDNITAIAMHLHKGLDDIECVLNDK